MKGQDAIALRMQRAIQSGDLPGIVVAAAGREEAGFIEAFGSRRLGAPDVPVPFSPPLEDAYRPNAEKIFQAAVELAQY